MKRLSPKKAAQYRRLAEIKKKNNPGICQGCSRFYGDNLDQSHTVSRKQAEHLAEDPENHQYLCRSCHSIWENGDLDDRKKLLNYQSMRDYMKENCNEIYQLQVTKGRLD